MAKNLTKKDLPEIPSREKIQIPDTEHSMGDVIGGFVIEPDDLKKDGKSISDIVDVSDEIKNVTDPNADIVPTGLTVSETGVTVSEDGTVSAYATLTWDEIVSNTFNLYQIRYKKGTLTYYNYIEVKDNTITIDGLLPSVEYNFGIASVNKYGIRSDFSATVNSTTATSTTLPATVTGVSVTAGIQYAIVEWTANSETDIASYNVYKHTSDSSGEASLIANIKSNYLLDGGLTGGTEYFYWVKAVNTSGLESEDFSTVDSATPRNVESADIVTIAGEKVLIDGTVYLSNWRKTGDLTKIDGGEISTNTITTTQLNFTPVQGDDVIASINASEEGIEISADRITINGKSYFTSETGARVEIFNDSNTGLHVIDDDGNDVFKTVIGGTNVGDVIIGDYAGNQGIFYDKSEGKTTFAGELLSAYGTFGTITAGTLQGVDIFGTNITGGTFYTSVDLTIYEADGATNPTAANGDYYKDGSEGGESAYTNGDYWLWYDDGTNHWNISNAKGSGDVQFDKLVSIAGTYDNVNGTGTFIITHVGEDKITINEDSSGKLYFYNEFGVHQGEIDGSGMRFEVDGDYKGQLYYFGNAIQLQSDEELVLMSGTSGDIEFITGGIIRPYPDAGLISNWKNPQLGDADHQYDRVGQDSNRLNRYGLLM